MIATTAATVTPRDSGEVNPHKVSTTALIPVPAVSLSRITVRAARVR